MNFRFPIADCQFVREFNSVSAGEKLAIGNRKSEMK